MTTIQEVSCYDPNEGEKDEEGYSLVFAVLMFLIYVMFPLLFWGLILWLIF